ncbi:hypothetical protein SCG7086_BK_00050 [Chlamydiales bacterium SCGC AG-110-P3]|nr:hypothetical protein SCG7086_BK_00050 [Chlamydiales bacterium SCGC AG-110-P3]
MPVSSQARPRPSTTTDSLSASRYTLLTSVISSSPRSEGRILFAMSITELS